MGEGWADFHALLLLVKDADRALPANANFNGTYPSNAYPLGGPGLRARRRSTTRTTTASAAIRTRAT